MALYLKLDQKQWVQDDFTSSTTYDLSGTVYKEPEMTNAVDISGETGEFRLIDPITGGVLWSTTQNITLNADGTFGVKFASGNSPVVSGSTRVRLKLESSGERKTAIGVNGSDKLYIEFD